MRKAILVLIVLLALVLSSFVGPSVGSEGPDAGNDRATVELPVEHRQFKMGVGPHPKNFPSSTWDDIVEGYQMAGRWGEVSNYWDSVPWYEEEDKLVGNTTTSATIQALYTDNGMVPVFQTNVWNLLNRPGYGFGAWLEVPPDLDPNITMADSEFRTRWVDHVRAIAREWQMEYYCLGNEVNSYHSWHAENAADFEANFPSLMAESYAAIKEVSPDTKVVLTFRLLELYHYDNADMLEHFNDTTCDIIAFTSYPSRTGDYDTPGDLPEDYYYRITEHTGVMPLAIAELGWTSHADFGGDEDEQAEFLTWFLEHTQDIPWEYVQWLELHDLRPEGSSTSHAQSVGLIRNDGTPKPVWAIWKDTYNLSYSRGWDLVPRGPILIDGDENFTLDNGVSSGKGTAEDPYIIEGWDIDGTEEGTCLVVRNTEAYYQVRSCLFQGEFDTEGSWGIVLTNSSNGWYHHNSIRDHYKGLHIGEGCMGNIVLNNDFIHCLNYAQDDGLSNVFSNSVSLGNFWDSTVRDLFGVADHDGTRWEMGVSIPGTANIDDDYPLVNPVTETQVPHEDQSSPVATTGDTMTFSLFSPVTEEMLSVEVIYKMGNLRTSKTLEPMDASWGSLWGSTVDVPSDLTVPIEYIFVITEMDWSPTVSNISFVDVHDDDPPWILDDITPSTASTGQELTFEVDVRDNIGVNYTRVEYWYGDDQAVNSSMVETVTDRWSHSIIVSPGLGDLHYIVHIVDMSGNWNSSEMTTLALEDKTPPEFGEDTTTEEGTTGDPVTFQVEVTDDVAVNNVSVEYGVYGTFYYEVADLVADGNVYSLEITLPTDMVGTVSYRFHAWDTSGNNATSEEDGIIVEDDDPPTATVELTLPAQVETGGSYQVTVSVFDNVGVWTVTIVMTFDTGRDEPSHRSQTLQGFGGTFTGNVLIGTNEVGTITHYIEVEDMYENYYNSSETVSDLVDTIPPDMDFLVPITTQVGREESIEVKATDNIGIVDVRWKGLPFKPDGFFANGSFDEPGEHRITVIVVDAAGNEATEDFVVFVEDDVSAATVMLQIAAILVLVAVGLFLVKWLMDRRSRESMGDPELEDAPSDEIPR